VTLIIRGLVNVIAGDPNLVGTHEISQIEKPFAIPESLSPDEDRADLTVVSRKCFIERSDYITTC